MDDEVKSYESSSSNEGISSSTSSSGHSGEVTTGDAGTNTSGHDGNGTQSTNSADASSSQSVGSADTSTIKYIEFIDENGQTIGKSPLSIKDDTVSMTVQETQADIPEGFYSETLDYVGLSTALLVVILVLIGAIFGALASRTFYKSLE